MKKKVIHVPFGSLQKRWKKKLKEKTNNKTISQFPHLHFLLFDSLHNQTQSNPNQNHIIRSDPNCPQKRTLYKIQTLILPVQMGSNENQTFQCQNKIHSSNLKNSPPTSHTTPKIQKSTHLEAPQSRLEAEQMHLQAELNLQNFVPISLQISSRMRRHSTDRPIKEVLDHQALNFPSDPSRFPPFFPFPFPFLYERGFDFSVFGVLWRVCEVFWECSL